MSHNDNNNDDHDVPNLGYKDDTNDDGAKFSEATVIRPRSVLDDAFDAHTIVRTEKSRRLEQPPEAPVRQAPPPMPPPMPARTPPPSSTLPPASNEMKDAVTNPSISRRFRKEASVTNYPLPQSPTPAGPTAAQLAAQVAEAQAVAQAQENARQRAEQAARQAAAQKAEQKAAQEAEQKAAQRAELEAKQEATRRAQHIAAQKAEQEAAAEAARRARQSAQLQGEQTGSFRVEETQSEFRMEPRRRKINAKAVVACVVAAAIGWYVVSGPNEKNAKGRAEKEIASVTPEREARKEPAPAMKAPPVEASGNSSQLSPAATVLSSFDDAFSRTQVRSRPDSQD